MGMEIELSRPIEAHGETVSVLKLSDPDLGALEDIRISVNGEGAVQLDLGDVQKLVANMADIPRSAAKSISLRDAPKLLAAVKDFFGDSLPIGG